MKAVVDHVWNTYLEVGRRAAGESKSNSSGESGGGVK